MRMRWQNKLIKPNKFIRQPKFVVNVIKTLNKFESLPIEECNMVEVENNSSYQENNTQEKYDVIAIETDKEKIGNAKK